MQRLLLQRTFTITQPCRHGLITRAIYRTSLRSFTLPALAKAKSKPLTKTLLLSSALPFTVKKSPHTTTTTTVKATPQELEAASEQQSDFLLVRIFDRLVQFLDDWFFEPALTVRRFAHILILFIPVALSVPVVFFGQQVDGEEKTGTLWWYDFLAKQMERAGPTFIKLAQWVASRTDLFPISLCTRLSKLHSQVDPHPFSYTKKVIEEAFGRPLEEVFSELDPEPLGVGAIAQVYRARIRPQILLTGHSSLEPFLVIDDNTITSDCVQIQRSDQPGEDPIRLKTAVAIKVLHPKARQIVMRDLAIMDFFARIFTLIPTMHWLSLPDEVRVFGEMMREQLDLRGEASNLQRFVDYFKDNMAIKIPKPLVDFTTKDSLMEEHIKAVPLGVFLKHAVYVRNKGEEGVFDHKLADLGLNAFLHMLIFFNFVHADLHPGNIMVEFYKPAAHHPLRVAWANLLGREIKDDGEAAVHRVLATKEDPERLQEELIKLDKEGYSPRLVFIDMGLVNELNQENRRNFLDLFQAIAQFDGYRAGELMVERCKSPELVIQPDVFALRMQNLILGLKQSTFHLGAVKIGNLLHETMNMVRAHHVKLEGDFVNVIVSIMLLEGIGRQLNPDLDLFKNALPVLRDYSIKEGGKAALELKNDPQLRSGHWLKVWIFLELRNYFGRDTRDEEWLQLCDILCPNSQ